MLRIHPEFESLIPQLTPEEHAQLEDNLLFEGCRDPLIVWKETDYLLDGHNRHEICEKFHIPYKIRRISFPDEATAKRWILTNQFGRRNLTPYQRAELALKLKPILEEEAIGRQKAAAVHGVEGGRGKKKEENEKEKTLPQNSAEGFRENETREKLAKKVGVSRDTISRSEFIDRHADDKTKRQLRRGYTSINAEYRRLKKELARKEREEKLNRPVELPPEARVRCFACDISEAAAKIEPESVDFIITDPPYARSALNLYGDLACFAMKVLKPGGSLLCMCGQSYFPQVINLLMEYLHYHWTLAYCTPGGQSAQLFDRKVNTFWKPVLWMVKGRYQGDWVSDVCTSRINDNDKKHHHWGQSAGGMRDLMKRFVVPGQVICDPFLGGGTTGVVAVELGGEFIGIDKEEQCVEDTKRRILKQFETLKEAG